ncbi:MAG: YbhB/YbcL family Raf kinase inhibitor-like protein [Egibacteraceae bacterium]
MAAFRLSSPAFHHDGKLPIRYTAVGGDDSPPLEWQDIPEGTKELVLVCEDPDADTGVVTHWVVYGILPATTGLPEGIPPDAIVDEPVELCQGLNEFDESGYNGPLPPEDRGPHRYFFRLYALDTELDIPPGVTRAELRRATKTHVIGEAFLVGIA